MKPIKYKTPFVFHYRKNKPDGSLSERGGVTVVFDPATRTFGASRCSKRDNYNKKRGAMIAMNRAHKSSLNNKALKEEELFVENIRETAEKIKSAVEKTKNPRIEWFEI
jgi:hypothetical protein